MIAAADIAAFVDAQNQLREDAGVDCVFHVPVAPTWPVGTTINPDTGEPYSAMAVRTNAADTDITKRVLVIIKQGSPLRPQADTHFDAAGMMSGMDIILDVSEADHAAVSEAASFTIDTLNYRLEEWKPFAIANARYRWLCYGQEK